MIRPTLFAVSLFTPLVALALDYSNATEQFTDENRLTSKERAAVSLLVHAGAIEGNPDGSFAAGRTLNRAEFVKIVLESFPNLVVSSSDSDTCFPDVLLNDWFSKYVCLAQRRDIIGGYPDGTFKPGNDVNYAEALKILGELYNLPLPVPADNERWAWYTPYVMAAESAGLDMPEVSPEALLTRGQMARLAAAYLAHSAGELPQYRDAEMGIVWQASSSSSATSQQSSSSTSSQSSLSSASSVSSTSSTSSAAATIFPARSSFLVAGQLSKPIADGRFNVGAEDVYVIRVEVELVRKVRSVKELALVDGQGQVITAIPLQLINNEDDDRYRIELNPSTIELGANTASHLGLKALMYTSNEGAVAGEYLQVKEWRLWVEGKDTSTVGQLSPDDFNIPQHQTSLARIAAMHSLLNESSSVSEGASRQIGLFRIAAQTATGAQTRVDSLNFRLQRSNVNLSNIRIGKEGSESQSCSLQESGNYSYVYCALAPSAGAIDSSSSVTLSILADLSTGTAGGTLQLESFESNTIGSNGTLTWSDGSGIFSWVEIGVPVDSGPSFTVVDLQ